MWYRCALIYSPTASARASATGKFWLIAWETSSEGVMMDCCGPWALPTGTVWSSWDVSSSKALISLASASKDDPRPVWPAIGMEHHWSENSYCLPLLWMAACTQSDSPHDICWKGTFPYQIIGPCKPSTLSALMQHAMKVADYLMERELIDKHLVRIQEERDLRFTMEK